MMPKMDGLEVLSRLREMGCRTPILLLTAKGAVEDRVAGLDLGADDYLPKPFVMEEFLARVRAMLRRREAFTPEILQYDDVTLHGGTFQLRRNGEAVTLPKLEYRLMEVLIRNQGIYLSSEDLLVKVWGYNTEAELGTVWVYLSYLRKPLAKLGSRVKIKGRRALVIPWRWGNEENVTVEIHPHRYDGGDCTAVGFAGARLIYSIGGKWSGRLTGCFKC